MLCLGIESSCDETALAFVEDGAVMGSVLSSQSRVHSHFGGVVPEIASREHYRFIGQLFGELLQKTGKTVSDIDGVSVTRGPGLLGSLLVGIAFAKMVALVSNTLFIGVNHLHAHIMAAAIERDMDYPFLGVLISGGHTNLYKITGPTKFYQLGRSIDDAVGETFDKVGSLLGMPYPAGKAIDDLASLGKTDSVIFPRPYTDNDNLDFSFSGLKTALSAHIHKSDQHSDILARSIFIRDTCACFNAAVADTICIKVERALRKHNDLRAIVVAGGAASNNMIRDKLKSLALELDTECILVPPHLCTDNAVMIAYLGWLYLKSGYQHPLGIEAIPRGKMVPDDMILESGHLLDSQNLGF